MQVSRVVVNLLLILHRLDSIGPVRVKRYSLDSDMTGAILHMRRAEIEIRTPES